MKQRIFDVVVVGGGPAGLSECIRSLAAGLDVAVISDVFGGCMGMMGDLPLQSYCNELDIQDAPLPLASFLPPLALSPTGRQYEAYVRENFLALQIVRINARVNALRQGIDSFELSVGPQHTDTLRSRKVVIATGIQPKVWRATAGQPRWKTCFEVYRALSQGELTGFKNKNVFILGNGNSAFQIALMLATVAKRVTILVKEYPGLYPQETDNRFALRALSQRTLELVAKSAANDAEGPLNSVDSPVRAPVRLYAFSELRSQGASLLATLPDALNSHPLLRASCKAAHQAAELHRAPELAGYELTIDQRSSDTCLVSAIGVEAQSLGSDWPVLIDPQTGFIEHTHGQLSIEGLYVAGSAGGYASVNTMVPVTLEAAAKRLPSLSWA